MNFITDSSLNFNHNSIVSLAFPSKWNGIDSIPRVWFAIYEIPYQAALRKQFAKCRGSRSYINSKTSRKARSFDATHIYTLVQPIHLHIDERWEAHALYLGRAFKDRFSRLSVYVYFIRRMCRSRTHTYIYSPHISTCRQSLWPVNTLSAPAIADTLDCTRSPLPTSSHFPTGSLLLEGEALSLMCADVHAFTHTNTRVSFRRWNIDEFNHAQLCRHIKKKERKKETLAHDGFTERISLWFNPRSHI